MFSIRSIVYWSVWACVLAPIVHVRSVVVQNKWVIVFSDPSPAVVLPSTYCDTLAFVGQPAARASEIAVGLGVCVALKQIKLRGGIPLTAAQVNVTVDPIPLFLNIGFNVSLNAISPAAKITTIANALFMGAYGNFTYVSISLSRPPSLLTHWSEETPLPTHTHVLMTHYITKFSCAACFK